METLQAEKRLKEESERVHAYLDKVSEERLLKECEQQLLANHQTALLDKEETGCRALLREGKTEGALCFAVELCSAGSRMKSSVGAEVCPTTSDLQRMYQLFKRLPNTSNACGLQPISQIVREHIVDVSFGPLQRGLGNVS